MKWIIPWHLRTSWNSTNSLLGLAPRLSPKTSIHQLLYLSSQSHHLGLHLVSAIPHVLSHPNILSPKPPPPVVVARRKSVSLVIHPYAPVPVWTYLISSPVVRDAAVGEPAFAVPSMAVCTICTAPNLSAATAVSKPPLLDSKTLGCSTTGQLSLPRSISRPPVTPGSPLPSTPPICLPIGNSRCTQVSTLNRSHNNCTSPNCTSTICTSTNCTSTICTSTNCQRSVVRPSCLTNQRRGTQQSSGCAQAAWAHNLKSAGLMRSSKRHGSLECLALVCVACTPCTNTAAPPEAHFSSHCSTKSIGQSGGPTPTTEGDHTTTTHKDTEQQHATCCLHVLCCNCFLCSDAYGMSWNQHGQSHRVRLIPHLSSKGFG